MTKTSNEQIKNSWESLKQAWKQVKTAVVSTLGAIRNILKWTYQTIDAWDKKIWEKIEENMRKQWKDTSKKMWHFFRSNILKTLLWVWLITWWWVEISKNNENQHDKNQDKEKIEIKEWTYLDKFWNDNKIFIIDVSEYNELNLWKFKEWNKKRWESKKEDARWVSGIYIRVQKEWWADKDFQKFYEQIKEYNKTAEQGQHIAVWWYIYFNKANDAISDKWIEKQVNDAINRLKIINDDNDWVVDLVPMLDFEFKKDPWVKSERWKKYKKAVLKRLKLFKEKTWITPGIYASWTIYHDYFLNDPEFAEYKVRIATYNWKRVDQSPDWHSVFIWPISDSKTFQPELIQFTEGIKWSWFWTEWRGNDNLDWSTTTKEKFKDLIIKNNDAPNDLYGKNNDKPSNINEENENNDDNTENKAINTENLQVDKGNFKYIKIDRSGKYYVYSYKIQNWWKTWWVKNQYIRLYWWYIQWIKVTDAKWDEISPKEKLEKWIEVYVKVPINSSIK